MCTDETLCARVEHLVDKMVGDPQCAGCIALVVGQVPLDGHICEHARCNVPRVVEDKRNVDVIRALLDRPHVPVRLGQVTPALAHLPQRRVSAWPLFAQHALEQARAQPRTRARGCETQDVARAGVGRHRPRLPYLDGGVPGGNLLVRLV
jgi:hypothetical protein